MRIETVTAEDPRVAEYRDLTDMQWRTRFEPESGFFLAEGEKVIARAAAAGYEARSVLLSPKWLPGMAEVFAEHDVVLLVAEESVLRGIVGFRLHRGALAAFNRLPRDEAASVIDGARTLVVLEGLVDHTNVGLIFRTAAALGIDGVLISPNCADPYYRRSVKTSMGAVLTMPWAVTGPWPQALVRLHEQGFTLAALTPAADAEDLSRWQPPAQPVALLLGTEGDGLSAAALQQVDVRLRIPVTDRVDSLNVAAAAAIACYALSTGRQ